MPNLASTNQFTPAFYNKLPPIQKIIAFDETSQYMSVLWVISKYIFLNINFAIVYLKCFILL